MTTNQLLLELKADCERLRERDLENVRSLVRFMLECYEIGNRREQLRAKIRDDFQKDHDEFIEENSLGGRPYRMPR